MKWAKYLDKKLQDILRALRLNHIDVYKGLHTKFLNKVHKIRSMWRNIFTFFLEWTHCSSPFINPQQHRKHFQPKRFKVRFGYISASAVLSFWWSLLFRGNRRTSRPTRSRSSSSRGLSTSSNRQTWYQWFCLQKH